MPPTARMYTVLEEQVQVVTKRNHDLAWSNEELLQMRHSDETYVELQDTRAMMKVDESSVDACWWCPQ